MKRRATCLVLALATACGSTVQVRSSTKVGGGLGDLSPAAQGPGGTGLAFVDGAVPTGDRSAVTARSGAAAAPTGTSPRAGLSPTAAAAGGLSGGTISIGVPYSANGGAVISALGGSGSISVDGKQVYTAVIDDANAHGGLYGRKIRPVFVRFDATGDPNSQEQAACETFTHDQRVFAAVGFGIDSYFSCLGKAGVPVVTETAGDRTWLSSLPLLVAPGSAVQDRSARAYVDGLARSGYFQPWNASTGAPQPTGAARVGVLTFDTPTYKRVVAQQVVPALRPFDRAPVVFAVAEPTGLSDGSRLATDMQSAVLKFRQSGVTHVVLYLVGGTSESVFLNTAEGQQYRPRYGFTSDDSIQSALQAGLITQPARQLAGAMGIGWKPVGDVAYSGNAFLQRGAAARCLAIAARAKISVQDSLTAQMFTQACDYVWLLQAAGRQGASPTAAAFLAGVARLGDGFASPDTQLSSFAGGRRDAASGYQLMRYEGGCDCVRYSAGVQRFPT